MTQRTTTTAVAAILGDNYVVATCPDLQAFIDTATLFVDRVITCAATKGITISDAEAERIEAYLAAHFYGHADQFFTSKSTVSASGSFQGQFGKGLESSHYGQTAMMIDPSGCVKSLSMGNRASMTWLGKPPSTQIQAVDRGYTR